MLQSLNRLGDVGVRVIKESKESTIESFRQLSPVLTELANSGDDFVNAFHVFLTYPFVDEVVGRDPQVARNLHMGDFTNLSIQLDVEVEEPGLGNLPPELDPTEIVGALTRCLRSGNPDSAGLPAGAGDAAGPAPAQGGVRQAEERGQGHLQAGQPGPGPAAWAVAQAAAAAAACRSRRRRSPACPEPASARPPLTGVREDRRWDSCPRCTTPTSCPCSSPGWWCRSDRPSHQGPADDLRADHPGRGQLRRGEATPVSTGCCSTTPTPWSRTSPTPAASSPAVR